MDINRSMRAAAWSACMRRMPHPVRGCWRSDAGPSARTGDVGLSAELAQHEVGDAEAAGSAVDHLLALEILGQARSGIAAQQRLIVDDGLIHAAHDFLKKRGLETSCRLVQTLLRRAVEITEVLNGGHDGRSLADGWKPETACRTAACGMRHVT